MNIKKIVRSREARNALMNVFRFIPDAPYLKLMYRLRMGQKLNLKNPVTFNEKLQWLKLHNRTPEMVTMVDKQEAKAYVAQQIGEKYIIPTLGVWDRFDDIDFDALPDQFVLKCTHDSGGLVVVKDKQTMDMAAAKKKIEASLKTNFYWVMREWPYKDVKPRIIAEQYMEETDGSELKDYKVYCFNGEPGFLYLSQGLQNHATARISYVTLDWQQSKYRRSDYREFEQLPPKPQCLQEMLELSRKLSAGQPFLRVDFYEINGQVYFGELTFYPGSGFTPLLEPEWDVEMGNMVDLTILNK